MVYTNLGKVPKKPNKTKYVRALFSIPDETYLEFKKLVPPGTRSQIVTSFMKKYVGNKKSKKKESFWREVGQYVKGDYSHEDPVKMAKDAWNHVD